MDKSVLKNLTRKRHCNAFQKASRHPEMVIKGERRPFGCAHHKTRKKKIIQSNPLNTETEGEGGVGALELSALTGLGS